MTRLIKFFKDWYHQWVRYFRMRKIDKISDQLEDGLLIKIQKRVALKKEILDYITKEFKVSPRSKYIAPSLRRQIVEGVYLKFREEMDQLGVVINYNLEFAK